MKRTKRERESQRELEREWGRETERDEQNGKNSKFSGILVDPGHPMQPLDRPLRVLTVFAVPHQVDPRSLRAALASDGFLVVAAALADNTDKRSAVESVKRDAAAGGIPVNIAIK